MRLPATTDLDADGKPDLVVTDRNSQTGVGTKRWQIFAGACDER
jgi:hypothetical protein